MLVVDASCLFEVVAQTERADGIWRRIEGDDIAVPHILDAEVLGVIRSAHQAGRLDETAAVLAVGALRDWPAERVDHRWLLGRAWELRANVRSWDALYVALAEELDAPLVTLDRRLAGASGTRCAIEVL